MIHSLLLTIRKRSIQFTYYSIALVLLLSASLMPTQAQTVTHTANLSAPTIISPTYDQQVTKQKPIITGLSHNDLLVDVYIDDVFNGRATTKNSPSGIASWSYTPFAGLSYGEHKVFTVARNADESVRSVESQVQTFAITRPYPTPIIKHIVQNKEQFAQPRIAGLALNNATVEVFIDGSFDGDLSVENDPSGTAHFAYTVSKELAPGWHSVAIRAHDPVGKTSKFTHEEVFEIQAVAGVSIETAPSLTGKDSAAPSSPSAPTLIHPETGSVTSDTQPTIAGVVHNNLSVEVFIDSTLNGETTPAPHDSGTTSFVYTPYVELAPGVHTVFARSVDEDGMKSAHSNAITLLVRPSGAHYVVTTQGVTKVNSGTVVPSVSGATSTKPTETNTDSSADTTTENTTTPDVAESPEPTTPIVVSESPEQPEIDTSTNSSDEDPLMVDDSPHDSEVVVIDTEETTDETQTQNKNTSVIIALAIAAIIIIGLISWFTTSKHVEDIEDDEDPSDDVNENQQEMPLAFEEPDTTYEPVWEIEPEPVLEGDETNNDSDDDDFVPPPPPPLNI